MKEKLKNIIFLIILTIFSLGLGVIISDFSSLAENTNSEKDNSFDKYYEITHGFWDDLQRIENISFNLNIRALEIYKHNFPEKIRAFNRFVDNCLYSCKLAIINFPNYFRKFIIPFPFHFFY